MLNDEIKNNSKTNFPSNKSSKEILSKISNSKTTHSNSFSETETIINDDISLENIDSSDIKIINLKIFKYRAIHQKKIIHKWYKIINCLIIIINIKKIKTQPFSFKTFNLMMNQLKNKNKEKISNNSNKNSLNESEKSKCCCYVKDQIKLFQLIDYGYDKHLNEIEELLKKNKFVNDPNYKKITPLFAACLNGYSDIAKVIIDNGGNYLKINSDGESILDVAVIFNYIKLYKFLLNYCKWPQNYINKSKNYIQNKTIEKNFKLYEKKNKQKNYCFCFKKKVK